MGCETPKALKSKSKSSHGALEGFLQIRFYEVLEKGKALVKA